MDDHSPEIQKQLKDCFTYAVARQCAHDAAVLFGMVAEGNLPGGAHSIAFVDTAVITYARPYSGNHGLKRLGVPSGLTSRQREFHQSLCSQRNEAVAHSDPRSLVVKVFEAEIGRWETLVEALPESTKELHRKMYWDADVQAQASETAWAAEKAWGDKLQSRIEALRELKCLDSNISISLSPRTFGISRNE